MTETITGKVEIENPDQASTNFYWTWEANGQIFNLQTTVRGMLTYEQIKAHIKTAMEATAHVQELGGIAKQVGRNADQPAATLPTATQLSEIPAYTLPGEDAPPAQAPTQDAALSFETEHLVCEIRNDKQFFKIKGGMWKKFGVVVWPEVLTAAGIPVEKLEGREYNLQGYVAHFELNDKGKPNKVVRLDKVA